MASVLPCRVTGIGCVALATALLATACVSRQPTTAPPPGQPVRGVLEPLTKPTLSPLTQPTYSLANFTDQNLPAVPAYAFVSRQTTLRAIQTSIDSAVKALFKDATLGPQITGPAILVYRGMTGGLDEAFTLEVGFPVQPNYQPQEGVEVKTLPAMRCLSVQFEGQLSAIDKAYDKVIPAVAARNLRRTGETREIYYNWVSPQSPENQVLIAVGVQ